jgi:hypothetical protein
MKLSKQHLKFSSYLTKHTLHLHPKNQLVNAVKEIIAVYSENYRELMNTLCGQNAESFNVQLDGTYNNHGALKGYKHRDFSIFSALCLNTL